MESPKGARQRAEAWRNFLEAEEAFADFYGIEELDEAHSTADETRFKMIAMSGARVLVVHYTMRGEKYRIISAREAENYEREIYDRERSRDAFYGQGNLSGRDG
jgi:uncharacterized DUF497 family protein